MSIQIRFVGGPADGRTMTIPNDEPPPLYLVPQPPSVGDLLTAAAAEPTSIPVAEYEPFRDGGWPRRGDDGTYLYGHRPAPVTPEARRALEEARQEAQVAEERRAAELDETWREIRKECPGYPDDWRDL